MDTISKGFERNRNKEFTQFVSTAKGSCCALRSRLYHVVDRNCIIQEQFENTRTSFYLKEKINAFINYLINSELKGSKYYGP